MNLSRVSTFALPGGYKAIKRLSTSKAGQTWLCSCEKSGQLKVIKELHLDPRTLQVWQTIKLLNHHALLTGTPITNKEGNWFVVRDYYHGTTLKELLSNKKIGSKVSTSFLINCFVNIADAINHLHEHGLLHCDIKPSNILVVHDEGLKPEHWHVANARLIDFGMCANYPFAGEGRRAFALGYAAPEQLLNINELLCPATDIFALGVTLYETITGKRAFNFHDPEMMLHIQLNLPVENHPALTPELLNVIRRATSKIPFRLPPRMLPLPEIKSIITSGIKLRYPGASEFARDLALAAK